MNSNDPFRVEKEGHIAWLILNRPEKRNTMGFTFYEGLGGHFDAFDRDPEVRVVIIRAEGKSFTAGTDLEDLGSLYRQMTSGDREDLRLKILRAQQGIHSLEKCRKPVIAAVHGHSAVTEARFSSVRPRNRPDRWSMSDGSTTVTG